MVVSNLNDVITCGGLNKHWIYGSEANYELSCDYFQKINYSIQDFNRYNKERKTVADICFLILQVTWIQEACDAIWELIDSRVKAGFVYTKETELSEAVHYLKALRSFVVAHPLTTNRHSKFGLDGEFVCVDIAPGEEFILKAFSHCFIKYTLRVEGLERVESLKGADYILNVYSKSDGAMSFHYMGCYITDLVQTIELFRAKLEELSKYLGKQRRKDYFN